MESIIFALLLLLGNVSPAPADLTLEDWIRAAEQARETVAESGHVSDGSSVSGNGDPQPDAPKVRGIYATANTAGGERLEALLALLDETELNSIVIDVKNDEGYITYPTDDPELTARKTAKPIIRDAAALLETLQDHDVYPIARVVVFKDSVLAAARPDLSFVQPDGTVWKNGRNEAFVSPYSKEVWEYNVQVAKDAAKLGFKEIQFDYVRFPEGFEHKAETLQYERDKRQRVDVVADFVKYAREQLEPLGVRISVDIFGYAASVSAAEGIGQDFGKISEHVHVICPMIYPSHYSAGWFGLNVPDAHPYETIDGAIKDTHGKLEPLGDAKPVVRPWIQDFTATWVQGHVTYGAKEVQAQIRALKDNGVDEFLLWNAGNRYTAGVDYDIE